MTAKLPVPTTTLRMTLKDLALGHVEKSLTRLNQLYYNKGNKVHSLLARKLSE